MRRIFVSDKSFIFAIQIVEACEDLHKIAVAAESICKKFKLLLIKGGLGDIII